jgi:predicted nucleic acid-binding protein
VSDRQWVVNASPLILLANIARISLLEKLCADLIIPEAFAVEVLAGPLRDAAQSWLEDKGQTYVCRVDSVDPVVAGWDLGIGESEVLTLARRAPEYEAILDDRAARNCAMTLNIPVRGTLGIVLLAKQEGLIERVQPVFQELLDAGLRITPSVLGTALDLAGE